MQRHEILITQAAEEDLAAILDYIAADSIPASVSLADEIEQTILKLEDFPQMGVVPKNRRLSHQGYRVLIVDVYLIFYVVLENKTVEIRRILSGKRDYAFLF
ncbi:MAG: type II toxin-antitoxin system RelE/ParE family toxin [Geobacteraceae bacterium]|nr:type II toxin-antitoxin system RelE/ParE family toxin [Geobacteraceae bacterium]